MPPNRRLGSIRLKSVRLRLLTLALLPMVVLMPLMLLWGMNRWTSEYDNILIANVESDLRIAEQYLGRILANTGANIQGVAESAMFLNRVEAGPDAMQAFLEERRAERPAPRLPPQPRTGGTPAPVVR